MLPITTLFACQTETPTTHEQPHHHEAHGAPHGDGATVTHRFDDPEKWSAIFDDPARDAWQKPAELVAALGIAPGAVVADIGAGTGYFEPHLAAAVGASGKVIAVDVEASLVEHMKERFAKAGLPQVEARLGAFEDPKLQPAEVDLVIVVDTYHHINDRKDYFSRLKTALKPGGKLVIVDFDPASSDEHGPPKEHRLPPAVVTEELSAAGYKADGQPPILPHQYVLLFRAG